MIRDRTAYLCGLKGKRNGAIPICKDNNYLPLRQCVQTFPSMDLFCIVKEVLEIAPADLPSFVKPFTHPPWRIKMSCMFASRNTVDRYFETCVYHLLMMGSQYHQKRMEYPFSLHIVNMLVQFY